MSNGLARSSSGSSSMFMSAIQAQELAHENYITNRLKNVLIDEFSEAQKRDILNMQWDGVTCTKIAERVGSSLLVVSRLINRTSWPGPRQIG